MNEELLRISLLVIVRIGDLDLSHVLGEMQSVWNARENVKNFINGENLAHQETESRAISDAAGDDEG